MNRKKDKHIKKDTPSIFEILFPEKYIKQFLVFYILTIPFLVGHLFLFTYIANFNFDIYRALCTENNSFLTWCMGYESFALIFFFILLFFSTINILSRAKTAR